MIILAGQKKLIPASTYKRCWYSVVKFVGSHMPVLTRVYIICLSGWWLKKCEASFILKGIEEKDKKTI